MLSSGRAVRVPKILFHLYNNSKEINKMLIRMGINKEGWLRKIDEENDFEEANASEIYASGLRA